MTNAIETLRSEIARNVADRLASSKAASMTANNRKKLQHVADVTVRNDDIATMLVACNYSAKDVSQNVYSVEKVLQIVSHATSEKTNFLSVYCDAIFQSMIALERANVEITRDVIATLCTNDVKTKYDAKIKATRVQTAKSASTVSTQHNSSINAYLALNMLNATLNANRDDVFTLNRENAAVQALAKRFDVSLETAAAQ